MKNEIIRLFKDSTLTIQGIADYLGTSYKIVYTITKKNFSREFRLARKKANYRRSKLGTNNPMYGRCQEQHHNFIGVIGDNKGYLMRLKPDWYTGRKKSKHIYEHHYQYCLANGLTEIPKGYHVHHKNFIKTDNDPDNLQLMTAGDHMRFHNKLRRAETIRKE